MDASDSVEQEGFKDGVEIKRLDSWKDYSAFVDELPSYRVYIFRGQKKANWKLESSLDRLQRKLGRPNDHVLRSNHLECFKRAICGRRGPNPQTLTEEDQWWVLGQQYGLETPLLDWTESPFVALFFAFEEPPDSKPDDRVIYAISEAIINKRKRDAEMECWNRTHPGDEPPPDDLSKYCKQFSNGPKMAEIVRTQLDENRNLISQRGLFTYYPFRIALEDWVRKEFQGESKLKILYKIVIPGKDRDSCLQTLNKMNINHLTLFPDLYGASKYCNMSLQIENY